MEAVNIDTGAVYGGALTSVGLSDESLAEGLVPVVAAFSDKHKQYAGQCWERTIRAARFGRARDDQKPLMEALDKLAEIYLQLESEGKLSDWPRLLPFWKEDPGRFFFLNKIFKVKS
ncbi:MAG: hypothetical protein LBO05_14855 [Deltaproteobacteria bacterium]|nr:hypothetical protein [Deltaproteobacteria bacterium]